MGFVIGGLIVCVALLAAWRIVRRPFALYAEEQRVDDARAQFRMQRERLEARFLTSLGKVDPIERIRWEDAQWRNEVVWVRDRQTRVFLALIGVHFEGQAYDEFGAPSTRQATALFEFRNRRWHADGKRLDEVRPHEVALHNHRFEPVALPLRRSF
jgi:hypothetical protein